MSATAQDRDALRLAFAAPFDRARASGGPLDRISLREHVREVEIGAFQPERGRTQRVRFDIVTEVAPDAEAVAGDDVDGVLSYDALVDAIDVELAAERLNLLETLAERIAARILLHARAIRVFVRIEKLDLGPHVLGVEIVRARNADLPSVDEDAPKPRVIYLSAAFRTTDHELTAMLDRLQTDATPSVICVAPDFDPPHAEHPMAQRRVDLLTIEQAAWRLAARDARCVVVDSRTELDWAMRHGRISVWAPSRIVLDATEGPDDHAPLSLARWFATEFQASDLVLVGTEAGTDERPGRHVTRLADI
ncbi:MAG: dihydroneopterin aldolase [Pseudomonadota bacterium]